MQNNYPIFAASKDGKFLPQMGTDETQMKMSREGGEGKNLLRKLRVLRATLPGSLP
jgi:hypothetical protein